MDDIKTKVAFFIMISFGLEYNGLEIGYKRDRLQVMAFIASCENMRRNIKVHFDDKISMRD